MQLYSGSVVSTDEKFHDLIFIFLDSFQDPLVYLPSKSRQQSRPRMESDTKLAAVQPIDRELLELSFFNSRRITEDIGTDNCDTNRNHFPPNGAKVLFSRTIVIDSRAPEAVDTGSRVEIKLKGSGDDRLVVLTNKESIFARHPEQRRKRRRMSAVNGDTSRLNLAVIQSQFGEEAELCTQIRQSGLPSAAVNGPYMSVNEHRAVIIEFGLAVVPDAAVINQKQQSIAIKFMAYALEDPSLLNPSEHITNPLELLRIITKTSKDSSNAPEFSVPRLRSTLLPYQRQSVNWASQREGKCINSEGKVELLDSSIRDYVVNPPLGWRKVPGSDVWANPYLLRTSSEDPVPKQTAEEYEGKGLSAEEMGLGKTVEILSLALLNQRPPSNECKPVGPLKIKTTSIIVPKTILLQWVSEIQKHAPEMSTLVIKDPCIPISELATADIAFVTYAQLSRWLRYTSTEKKRTARVSRHNFLDHIGMTFRDEGLMSGSKLTSLVKVQFWRVVLDEVQMVHTGESLAALTARRIPRVHAWAVSGTPVKHSLEDMRGIIKFLDLTPFVARPCWQRLIASPIDIHQTMSSVAMRHTRPLVAKQLHIPRQHRRLILLKFSPVERLRYDRLYDEFLEDSKNSNCNLHRWLLRLRQICSHTVAQSNQAGATTSRHRNVNNLLKNAGLGSTDVVALTSDQVLSELMEDADSELWTEKTKSINAQLRLGQLYDKYDQMRHALTIWQNTLFYIEREEAILKDKMTQVSQIVSDHKADLDKILDKRGLSKNEPELESDSDDSDVGGDEHQPYVSESTATASEDFMGVDSELLDKQRNVVISSNHAKALRLRFRSLRELKHRTFFSLGTGYFRLSQRMKLKLSEAEINNEENQLILKENMKEESKFYKRAENMRNDISKEAENKVSDLYKGFSPAKFLVVNRIFPTPKSKVIDKITDFYQEIVDALQKILTEPLMDDSVTKSQEDLGAGVQAETDAYSKTLDLQENAFVYSEMLQLLIRDRAAAVNGGNVQANASITDDEEQSLGKTSNTRRDEITELLRFDREPIITCMRASHIKTKFRKDLQNELKICQYEYSVLRDSYNARVDYYKQLQDLSDQVADIEIDGQSQIQNQILKTEQGLAHSERRINDKLKMQTYLRNLEANMTSPNHSQPVNMESTKMKDEECESPASSNVAKFDPGPCTICLETIVDGAITPCYHSFCADCSHKWIRNHDRCPLCSHPVKPNEVLPVSMVDPNDRIMNSTKDAVCDQHNESFNDDSHASDLYLPVSKQVYGHVRRIPLHRMYGVKIDTIVQLVMYIRSQDPTAQIVVFSQWMTMLKVSGTAFQENGIKFGTTSNASIDINNFRTDSNIACLLLHAKADVAGLTLVNANHVFLCEPLMNTAIELQAVSRINRFGQTRETTAWQFCVEKTVEQTISGMTAKARSLQVAVDGDMEQANSAALVQAMSKGNSVDRSSGAEIVDNGSLRRVLFKQSDDNSNTETADNI